VVCLSVCLSVGHVRVVSPAKTAEPIEMPFGGGAADSGVQKKSNIRRGSRHPTEKGNFGCCPAH